MVSAIVEHVQRGNFDEDLLLVERYLSGEPAAFESLYRKYYDRVFVIAKGVVLDAEEAADTTQEIFRLVMKNLARFDQRARFSTWLYRIAVNRSIQQARSVKRRGKGISLDTVTEVGQADAQPDEGDPRIEAALAELSSTDRAILTLFYWQELSLNDIASSIGCTANACKTRLFRARERFRDAYERMQ